MVGKGVKYLSSPTSTTYKMCAFGKVTTLFEPYERSDEERGPLSPQVLLGLKQVNSLGKCLGVLRSAQQILEHSLVLNICWF